MCDDSGSTSSVTQNDSKDETFIPDRSFDSDDSRASQTTSGRVSVSNQVGNTVQNQSTLLGLQNPDTGRNTLHLPIQRRRLGVPAELSSNIVKEDISFDSSTESYSFVPNLSQSSTELVNMSVITSLEAAFRILPKFDKQDSEGLHNFIKSSEFAFSCISEEIKPIILGALVANLTAKAAQVVRFKKINSWEELKTQLKNCFEPQHTSTHLMLELTTTRQKYDEEISTFYSRLEKLFHLTLNVQTKDKSVAVAEVIEGILKTQTLSIFIEGLRQPIKMLVKASHPSTIEEAFAVAQQEETSYKSDKETQSKIPKQNTAKITCFNCGKVGHMAKVCRSRTNHQFIKQPQENQKNWVTNTGQNSKPNNWSANIHRQTAESNSAINNKTIVCKYCKKLGHEIGVCRKLKYNNEKRASQANLSSMTEPSTSGNETGSIQNGERSVQEIKATAVTFQEHLN